MRQVQMGLGATACSALAPATSASAAIDAMFQQREVQLQRFDAKDYLGKVNPTAADVEAYYKNPAHAAEFQTQEKADIEYAVLDLESIMKGIKVPEDEIKKYYTENEKNYMVAEERRASHILIKAAKDALGRRARQGTGHGRCLAGRSQQEPWRVCRLGAKELARQQLGRQGGDLDLFFGRGDTDKAYEDAIFALKPGDLSPRDRERGRLPHSSTQGHAWRREARLRKRSCRDRAAAQEAAGAGGIRRSAATEFTNTVYEQADSLKPVADKLKLELRSAKGGDAPPASATPAAPWHRPSSWSRCSARTLCATSAIPKRSRRRRTHWFPRASRNTAPRPRRRWPRSASRCARRSWPSRPPCIGPQGRRGALGGAAAGAGTGLRTPVQRSRVPQSDRHPRPVVDAVLKAPGTALPAVAGIDLGDQGYVVVRILKVLGRDPVAADATRASAQYAQSWAAAEVQAYYAALKSRFKVDVHMPASAEAAVTK